MSYDDDDDEVTDETFFGDQAVFLQKFGGDIFGNGSYASYRCNLCSRYFAVRSVGSFNLVMGMYTDSEAPARHAKMSSWRSKHFEELQRLHGICECYYRSARTAWAPDYSSNIIFELLRSIAELKAKSEEELNGEDSEDDD